MDSWASSPFRGWEVGLEIQPFGIGEVGRVALSHAPERTRSLCSGAFSNSLSGKLAEQARLPTPRYQWGIFFARLCSVQCDSSGGGCPTPRRVFIKAGADRRSLLAGTNKSACSLIYSPSWQLVFMPYTPLSPSSLELLQVPALAAGGFLSYQFLTLTR